MKKYIYNYLDKRYPIVDNVCHINETISQRIEMMFGVDDAMAIAKSWLADRIGPEYILKDTRLDVYLYYKDGKCHREGAPAVIFPNGSEEWWVDGKRHREDGPALICVDLPGEGINGYKSWYFEGKRHREDGPAVIYGAGEFWYKNDKMHRDDGPAEIRDDGSKFWYKDGQLLKDPRKFKLPTSVKLFFISVGFYFLIDFIAKLF